MLTVISPINFVGLTTACTKQLGLPNKPYYFNSQEIDLYLDETYDVHIFEYFYNYLVLFGNQKLEFVFRLKYSDYLYD